MSLNSQDRRAFYRMNVDSPLKFQLSGDSTLQLATAKSLSSNGMMFVTETQLSPGQLLDVVLTPSNQLTPPLVAGVEVVRCTAEQDHYLVACRILRSQ